jgi:hypothetical protein
MTGWISSLRRQLAILAVFTLGPGMTAFFFAGHHRNSMIQPSGSVDVDGLRINESVIDIGKVWSGGASVQRVFTLENRTGDKILIESVKSDCGCTVPSAVASKVQNGKSTKISVIFWPPPVDNDRGGEFKRTITVIATTIKGKKSIFLTLTGFVEPDASLRVFPVNVDIEAPSATTAPSAILHFKGTASILASIPNTLLVSPGQNNRVLVRTPSEGQVEAIGTKDVEIGLSPNASFKNACDWVSAITFAPDQFPEGLTVHVRGRVLQSILATPQSIILTDDPTGHEATVCFTNKTGGSLLPESVETHLPIAWDFSSEPLYGNSVCTLHIHIRKPMSMGATGVLRVRLRRAEATSETISIPLVILHCDTRESSSTNDQPTPHF